MDFTLNSEQEMLRESARRFIDAQRGLHQPGDLSPEQEQMQWTQLVEMGWTAIAVPEHAGGFGSTLEDMAVLFMEIGRGQLTQPLLASSVLASSLLRQSRGDGAQQLLQELAEGQAIISVALHESGLRYELFDIDTLACENADGYEINGSKVLAPGSQLSNQLVFTARLAGTGELGVFTTPVDTTGIHQSCYPLFDGSSACDYRFENLHLPHEALLAGPYTSAQALEDAVDDLLLMLCAETVGNMEQAIQLTADYLQIREQFGTPLASFQALQHQVADMFIDANHAKSSLYQAIAAKSPESSNSSKTISGCMVNIMSTAIKVIGTAIHLHGGIGFTSEHQVGHLYRRALVNSRLYGNIDHHLSRYQMLQGKADAMVAGSPESVDKLYSRL